MRLTNQSSSGRSGEPSWNGVRPTWWWLLTKPGSTTWPGEPSVRSAAWRASAAAGPTSTMVPSRSRTAPSSITDAAPSALPVTTYRPRISVLPMAGWRPRAGGARSGPRGGGLLDAAPHRAGLDPAPEALEPLAKRASVRRTEPEPHHEPIATGRRHVLIGGAAVVDHVIVQELNVAGPEVHVVAQLVAHLRQQVEGLVLRGGEPRDRGDL